MVDRAESKMVASKAMPSSLTMESASKEMLMEQPSTDRNVNGPKVRAVTRDLGDFLNNLPHRLRG